MTEINPLLLTGGVIGAITAILVAAYALVKDKKATMGFERTMNDGEIMRRLMAYAKPYRKQFVVVLFLMLFSIAYDIISPLIVGNIEELVATDFALPALYAQFRAPARRIYADEAADFLTLLPDEEEGASRLLAPAQLQLLYSSLHVMPDGAPAALLLTEECTRTVYAVQLLPPFVWEDPLPPLPDAPAALSLTLTMRDVEEIDACPAALGHRLACDMAGKRWLHHPRAETYLSERVALFQRLYR